MKQLVCVLLGILFLNFSVNGSIRQTANGAVEGIERISSFGKKYFSFRGIPYAEAPISGIDPYSGDTVDRRFKVV